MAAATVTAVKVEDGFFHAKYVLTGAITDTGESAVTKIDASALAHADAGASFHELSIHSVEWNIADVDASITLLFTATANQTALILIGQGKVHGAPIHPNTAATGFTGDIKLTTSGMSNPSAYQITIVVRKGEGFVSVPVAVSAAVTDVPTLFVTGDAIHVDATFSEQVHVTPVPELELKIRDVDGDPDTFHTMRMKSTTAGYAAANKVSFVHTITDEDFALEETVSLGALLLSGAAKITGGFAQSPARLTGFTSNLSSIEINPNRIIAASFSNDAASEDPLATDENFYEGDHVTLTLTFGQPVEVTDEDEIKVDSGSLDTGTLSFAYVGGSGTRQLTFAATVPAVGVAQADPTSFDLVAGIDLGDGDAIESVLTGIEPVGVSAQDWSDLIDVAAISVNYVAL